MPDIWVARLAADYTHIDLCVLVELFEKTDLKEPQRPSNFELGNCLRALVSVKKEQRLTRYHFHLLNKTHVVAVVERSMLFFVYAHLDPSFTQIKI
jgi:hypothetical protein